MIQFCSAIKSCPLANDPDLSTAFRPGVRGCKLAA
jgi:hypothetical protein